jgi:hypothetical protein
MICIEVCWPSINFQPHEFLHGFLLFNMSERKTPMSERNKRKVSKKKPKKQVDSKPLSLSNSTLEFDRTWSNRLPVPDYSDYPSDIHWLRQIEAVDIQFSEMDMDEESSSSASSATSKENLFYSLHEPRGLNADAPIPDIRSVPNSQVTTVCPADLYPYRRNDVNTLLPSGEWFSPVDDVNTIRPSDSCLDPTDDDVIMGDCIEVRPADESEDSSSQGDTSLSESVYSRYPRTLPKRPTGIKTNGGKPSPKPHTLRRTNPKKRIGKGRVAGINKATGQLTLVGMFPPTMRGPIFHCIDPRCSNEAVDNGWTTQNGYKYHLLHRCYGNPNSEINKKIAAGEPVKALRSGIPPYFQRCEFCSQGFTSANGYQKHKYENESTMDGRCANRARGGLIAGEVIEQSQTGGKYSPTGDKYSRTENAGGTNSEFPESRLSL